MNDDVLREAARALREEADASRARPGETRARVMRSLRAQRARRLTTVRVVVPLAAVLVGSVAWASAARWFPAAWHDLASQLGLTAADPPDIPPGPPSARRGPRSEAPAPPEAPPQTEAPAPPEAPPQTEAPAPPEAPPQTEAPAPPEAPPPLEPPAPPEAPLQTEAPAPAPPAPSAPPVSARAPRRAAVPPPSPAARAAPDEADRSPAPPPADAPQAAPAAPAGPDAHALYQAAHRAHFVDRDPAAALAAWDTYLAAAPRGRFAVEARYNRALCLVRLGHAAEARRALAPFARGAFGGYRQTESRSLIEALSGDGR
ncbi:hypothetical protein SOCEGT47_042470 [Sorangium cellulosum]|uniref:Uncharacterized protein n=1 Tax=Sorangium cellulosum TaxID=56 RepID=A0A4P2Q324_SORCE|nr:hypothetical protein [Sorangium cellulosum]AUX23717.1 hypothetical protein SOCEGT47_042470 [Sorangium cellulosum]